MFGVPYYEYSGIGILAGIVTISGIFSGFACVITGGVNDAIAIDYIAQSHEVVDEKADQFANTVAKKAGADITPISANLLKPNDNYVLRVFGVERVSQYEGDVENNYVNVHFDLKEEDANKIIKAFDELNQSENVSKANLGIDTLQLDYNGVQTFDVTKKTKNKLEAQINDNAVTRVYDALTNAVKNAYNQTKESITNADAVDIQLYQENNYSIPTKTTDIYVRTRFTKISSRKNETIIVPINISEVKKDADRNVSYFYIDSLIYNDKNLEYQEARVEVEGVDLTQAQVYAKFIKSGQDVNFVQLAQQNISNEEDDLVLF